MAWAKIILVKRITKLPVQIILFLKVMEALTAWIIFGSYVNDVTVLKGLGKTMLCVAMNILLKTHTIDTICLTAQSRRKDDAFYKELVHNWSGEMIARYIIDKRWGPYYNKTIDGYCDYECSHFRSLGHC
jgi:hypothetical protein